MSLLFPSVDYPLFGIIIKTVRLIHGSVIPDRRPDQNSFITFLPSVCFLFFIQCFCFRIVSFPMDPLAAKFTSLTRKDLSLLKYAVEFSQLTVLTAFDDAALNSLFWIGYSENMLRLVSEISDCYLIGLSRWWVGSTHLWIISILTRKIFHNSQMRAAIHKCIESHSQMHSERSANVCSDLQMHRTQFTNECQAKLWLEA